MFNHALAGQPLPKRLSTDRDPLFGSSTVGSPICASSRSCPFVERLIGTVRRDYMDRTSFWNALDLTRMLGEFSDY